MPTAFVYKTKSNWEKTDRILSPVVVGLQSIGWKVDVRESLRFPQGDEIGIDLAVVWGDTGGVLQILASRGRLFKQVLQVDNGYLKRERWTGYYSLSYGGQRQCQEYVWDCPRFPERFAVLHETIKPWRTEGATIIILAPSHKQAKILGFDTDQWARRTMDQIQRYTKKRVLIKIKRYNVDAPLRETLQKEPIFAAVGYNTKGLVECLLEGIPVFSLGPCVTEKMGGKNLSQIENPLYPDNRQEFFERLAGTQFLLSEITNGVPFLDILPRIHAWDSKNKTC